MTDSTSKAVFLSYASQDAEAAKRIADALRAAGVEVWFDAEGGLEHGDEWDAKIRRQIKECVLFIPIISGNTQAREEGYFRIEWELAAQRALGIASGVAFILPVVIDGTKEPEALVPDRFRTVQWTRLRNGEVPSDVLQRFLKLWSHRTGALKHAADRAPAGAVMSEVPREGARSRPVWPWVAVAFFALCAAGVIFRPWRSPAAAAKLSAQAPAAKPGPEAASRLPAVSEARRLADRGFAMSVEKYDSSLDDFTAAEDLLKRALALDPNDGEIWARSAELNLMYRNRGFDFNPARIAAGREQAERAVRLAPDSAEVLFARSLAQRYTGNYAESAQTLQRVVEIDPGHARALLFLGSYLIGRNRKAEGFALFDRARQQREWAPLADYFEYLGKFSSWRFADADQAVRRSFAETPSGNSAAGIAVLHLTWKGDLDDAAREFEALPQSLRNTPRLVWIGALVHLARRAPDEALKVLDRLPDEFFLDSWATGPKAILVGRAHALAGREMAARIAWEAGLPVVEAKLKAEPGDAASHNSRGELLAWLGRADEALAEARTVAEINRGPAQVWTMSEARIYAILGRADLAVPALEALLKPDTNWPVSPTLLRLDPLWDRIRGDPRFQELLDKSEAMVIAAAPPRDWPKDPELKKVFEIVVATDATVESCRLAEDMVDAVLKQRPTDPEATVVYATLNNYFINRGYDLSEDRYVLARRFAERALQLAPHEPEAMAAMAQFLTFRGTDFGRAEELIRQAMELAPQEPRFARVLAYNVLRVTDPDKALVQAKEDAVRFPRDALTQYDLALICRGTGDVGLMEQALDHAIALAPIGSAMIWKGWLAAWVHGDLQGFKVWLDRISGNFRLNERAVYMRYLYGCLSGDAAYGLEAVRSFPGSWMNDFYYIGPRSLLLADLLALQGKPDLAREEYERALAEIRRVAERNPNETSWERAEFWTLVGLGRKEEARVAAKHMLERMNRPFRPPIVQWWHDPVPSQLLGGDRADALALMREAAVLPAVRDQMRTAIRIDRRMAPFRNDPEIKALLAEPEPKQ